MPDETTTRDGTTYWYCPDCGAVCGDGRVHTCSPQGDPAKGLAESGETPAKPAAPDAAALKRLIAARFCAPEWATFFEVRDAASHNATRTADAVAMSTYAGSRHPLHGFEVKVSRNDWRAELKQPEKWMGVGKYCDAWWIVAPRGLVQPAELIMGWGLLETCEGPNGEAHGALRVKVQAATLTPNPLTRSFIAVLLRQAVAQGPKQAELRAARKAGAAAAVAEHRVYLESARAQTLAAQERVRVLEGRRL